MSQLGFNVSALIQEATQITSLIVKLQAQQKVFVKCFQR